ncbi:MAG: HD domain-containing phosphohydrolase [Nitrospirota bacterium]
MIKEPRISLLDLILSISDAMDLAHPLVANHQERVAYIAFSIAKEIGLSVKEQNDIIFAGAIHDIGLLTLEDKMTALEFEFKDPYRHAEIGYRALRMSEQFSKSAVLIHYHHTRWNNGAGANVEGEDVPIGSHILHLSDRIEISIDRQQEILGQAKKIRSRIEEHSGEMFMPELVDAFINLSKKEYFWLDATSQHIGLILPTVSLMPSFLLGVESLTGITDVFRKIIDFRSRFTATHTSGIAATSEMLARLMGFSQREYNIMRIAGNLHDLGKLAVPSEILEKPASLNEDEFNVIRSHTYHTYRLLERIKGLETINEWGAFHHERMDGRGYPFHHKGEDLTLGSRIMAVADVFTAITEDRPYRKGMALDRALQVVQQMAEHGSLDSYVVSILKTHSNEIDAARVSAQSAAVEEYRETLD